MTASETLRQLLEDYLTQVDELMRTRSPRDGILGLGGGPKEHPCHAELDQRVEALVQDFVRSSPSPEEAAALVRQLLLSQDLSHGEVCSDLMLQAVQRHAGPLLPLLTPQDAAALYALYTDRYPRHQLLPAQKQLVKQLKKRMG